MGSSAKRYPLRAKIKLFGLAFIPSIYVVILAIWSDMGRGMAALALQMNQVDLSLFSRIGDGTPIDTFKDTGLPTTIHADTYHMLAVWDLGTLERTATERGKVPGLLYPLDPAPVLQFYPFQTMRRFLAPGVAGEFDRLERKSGGDRIRSEFITNRAVDMTAKDQWLLVGITDVCLTGLQWLWIVVPYRAALTMLICAISYQLYIMWLATLDIKLVFDGYLEYIEFLDGFSAAFESVGISVEESTTRVFASITGAWLLGIALVIVKLIMGVKLFRKRTELEQMMFGSKDEKAMQ